jgi:ubiquinone/menaquinone biosynthesis C-methylase UbiE
MDDNIQRAAEAFSQKAGPYDSFGDAHVNLARMRRKVYTHVERWLRPGDRILELNAGTGIDAAHFAGLGYPVHATDIAPGMLAAAAEKAARQGSRGKLTVQACSFTELDRVDGAPYDYLFSNFGGLNCAADLGEVARQVPTVLAPGGRLTWVIMPPVCPWDLALALRGEFGHAFRRLRRGGTLANVAGVRIRVNYFTPGQVQRALGDDFRILEQAGLSVFTPTADRQRFALRYPRLFRWLTWLDDRLSPLPPFNGWGDFFMLSLEYRPR